MSGPLRHRTVLPPEAAPHVAIVGGGASGVLMALHLLNHPGGTGRVTLLEGTNLLGCGLAYSTTDPDHLLNTRVQNMSAFPDHPDHFLQWLMQRDVAVTGMDFVTRSTYGGYLGSLLQPWLSSADRRLACLRQSCDRVEPLAQGYRLHLRGGGALLADRVVLATGHAAAAANPLLHNGWAPVTGLDLDAAVVILGTGLSMVDQVMSLLAAGHRGPITAISRRGLLPREHAPVAAMKLTPQDLPQGAPISGWLLWLRDLAQRDGGDWRAAVDGLRPHLRTLWGQLPEVERRRFLRHAVTWWDVHRHRIPPASAKGLRAALASGQLRVRRGRFQGITAEGGRLKLALAGPMPGRVCADLAVDCRGIRRDPAEAASALLRDLLARGHARIDPLRIGLDVAPDCRLIAADGTPQAGLFAIGPVSRAAFWEITAIPDIREQVMGLAGRLTDPVVATRQSA